MYVTLYAQEIPPLLEQLAESPEMKRLADIGMHCGCEYTQIAFYQQELAPYNRFIHSLGVASIIWNFTKDVKQAVAGLFHDISTPVFAHTVDFLNDDHMTQESTEHLTRLFIEKSPPIMRLLRSHGISVEEIDDYHRYPIADNDTPMLSADRLEYTLGNAVLLHRVPLSDIQHIYDDLTICMNGLHQPELTFRTMDAAKAFFNISITNSRQYVSDEDRFAMQYLADLLRDALDRSVLAPEDLYTTETELVRKMEGCHHDSRSWEQYTRLKKVAGSDHKPADRYCVNVSAKKRYINPLVLVDGQAVRLADADTQVKKEIDDFLQLGFDRWLYAV